MNKIDMIKFGRTLTDRPYGKQVAGKLVETANFPVSLDFAGVISLGSSFGDEVLSAIKAKQEVPLVILNANDAIKSCLEKVSKDLTVGLEFR